MIGILGGTFDPVHYGHLRSALEAKEIFALDQVRMIPAARPPHRGQPSASAPMRVAMLKLAIANQPGLICDTRELDRAGHSYMIDTLESLHRDFPEQSLLLLLGCDAFNGLTAWHQWRRLFDYAHIAVLTRPGFAAGNLADFFTVRRVGQQHELHLAQAGKLYFQPITQLDISATAIRSMIAAKQNPGFLLPDAVIDFICENHLYEN